MKTEILITGDFCPINRNETFLLNGDYPSMFGEFTEYSRAADLSITNLECPLTNETSKINKTGPCIKARIEATNALDYANFNLVTLANNHIMDYGSEGLKDTLKALNAKNIHYVGAGGNLDEARKPYYYQNNGLKFGVLNFAENEFCTTQGDDYGANPLDPLSNFYDIQKLKKEVDYVIVIVHGGREHYQLPTPRIRKTFRFYIDAGADIVISHHTHCFSGFEQYNDKLIFYGLGNFLFDYKKKYQIGNWTRGYGVRLNFEKNTPIDFKILPYKQGQINSSSIRKLTTEELETFNFELGQLNEKIQDDELFFKSWHEYLDTQKNTYRDLLYIQNNYIRKLVSMKLFPRIYFRSRAHETLLLNLFKCETHHEILTATIDKKLP